MDACDGDQDVIPLRLGGVEGLSALTSGKSCTSATNLASNQRTTSAVQKQSYVLNKE